MRILVIEDDRDLIDLYREYVSQIEPSARFDAFTSVEEYMKNFFVPDFIVVDVNLPGMSGLSILSEVSVKYSVPTLVITGLEDSYIDKFVLRFPFARLLRKPVLFSNFYKAFKDVLNFEAPRLYGSIEAFPIPTLIQVLASSAGTWLIEIMDKGVCKLFIMDGRIRYAECNGAGGVRGAFRMLNIDRGEFVCHYNPTGINLKPNMDMMPEELVFSWILENQDRD